jgi:hypothetical protein
MMFMTLVYLAACGVIIWTGSRRSVKSYKEGFESGYRAGTLNGIKVLTEHLRDSHAELLGVLKEAGITEENLSDIEFLQRMGIKP